MRTTEHSTQALGEPYSVKQSAGCLLAPWLICTRGGFCPSIPCGTPEPSVPRRGEGARMKPRTLLRTSA